MKTVKVVAAIIQNEDKIFATQRGYGDFKGGWEFPGGKVEPGETPREALAREIREELDTEIAVGDLFDTVEYDYPTFHLSMQCYLQHHFRTSDSPGARVRQVADQRYPVHSGLAPGRLRGG
ncbi:MAG: (deoxy)nucleoside triphosphate pyrophosphohydrolase [Clostridiales bacterium]|nr:(deoxy)nucleoside triphosphate pyrophosphohydrolase [Clostridiales bacterium]